MQACLHVDGEIMCIFKSQFCLAVARCGDYMSLVVRKSGFRVSNQVRHKPGCTATDDGLRLAILDLGSRGIVLFP